MPVVSPNTDVQTTEAGRENQTDQQRYEAIRAAEEARLTAQRAAEKAQFDAWYQQQIAAANTARGTDQAWSYDQLQALDQAAWDERTKTSKGNEDIKAAADTAAQTQLNKERDAIAQNQSAVQDQLTAQQNEALRIQNAQMLARQTAAGSERDSTAALLARMQQASQDQQAREAANAAAATAYAAKRAADARTYATGRTDLIDKYKTTVDNSFAGFNDDYFQNFAKDFVNTYKPQIERDAQAQQRQTTYGYANAGNLNSTAAAEAFGNLDRNTAQREGELGGVAADRAQTYRKDIAGQKASALSTLFTSAGIGQDSLPEGADVTQALGDIGTHTAALAGGLGSMTDALKGTTSYLGFDPSVAGVVLPGQKLSSQGMNSALTNAKAPSASSGYTVS